MKSTNSPVGSHIIPEGRDPPTQGGKSGDLINDY
jgi:hypothetical protein